MPLEIVTIPCLSDNYAFLLHDNDSGDTALVDAPEAKPILAELSARGWTLSEIWLTHHHGDHIDGVGAIKAATGARILGAAVDATRLPPLDISVREGVDHTFAGHSVQVFDVSGHTVGHIALYVADAGAMFTADSLMTFGCGRLFEGTADQMYASLGKLAALPGDTLVCSGHEYTETNARFALTIEPDNAKLQTRVAKIKSARAADKPTVPSILSDELETNPFLRAHLPEVKSAINMAEASDVAVFAEIRRRKDAF